MKTLREFLEHMILRFKVDLRSNKLVRVDVKNPKRDTSSVERRGVKPRVKLLVVVKLHQ